jgi:hypothetical protein
MSTSMTLLIEKLATDTNQANNELATKKQQVHLSAWRLEMQKRDMIQQRDTAALNQGIETAKASINEKLQRLVKGTKTNAMGKPICADERQKLGECLAGKNGGDFEELSAAYRKCAERELVSRGKAKSINQ